MTGSPPIPPWETGTVVYILGASIGTVLRADKWGAVVRDHADDVDHWYSYRELVWGHGPDA